MIAVANSRTVRLATGAAFPFPGGSAPLQPESILPVDFNYDFKMDLVLAGESGVRFLRQESPTSFTDVTAQTKLPAAVLNAGYTGAWASISRPMGIWTSCWARNKGRRWC